MGKIYSFPSSAKHFHLFESDDCIKNHADYVKAKAGDHESAFRLIKDLAEEFIGGLKG